MRKSMFLALLVLLVTLGLIGGYLYFVRQSPTAETGTPYLQKGAVVTRKAESFWRERIKSDGPVAAYKKMIDVAHTLVYLQSHALTHAFGLSLYKELGVSGFVYCGSEFAWGCAHHFVAVAIEEHGDAIADDIMTECKKLDDEVGITACEHGIGHGLVAHGDYSLESLRKVLSECEALHPGSRINGCATGAFMEYNFRRLESYRMQDSIPVTPLTSDNTYGPCYEVGAGFRPTCVRELPNWWTATEVTVPFSERVSTMGKRCSEIDGNPNGLSGACFEGMGRNIAAEVNLNADKVVTACNTSTEEPGYRLRCLSGAAYEFRAANAPDFAATCENFKLSGASLWFCQKYMTTSPSLRGNAPVPTGK